MLVDLDEGKVDYGNNIDVNDKTLPYKIVDDLLHNIAECNKLNESIIREIFNDVTA